MRAAAGIKFTFPFHTQPGKKFKLNSFSSKLEQATLKQETSLPLPTRLLLCSSSSSFFNNTRDDINFRSHMKRSAHALFRVRLTTTPNFLLRGGRPQIIAHPIQSTLIRTMVQWKSKIAWIIMRESRRNALERENQHPNDRLLTMQNGEREEEVGKSEVAVMKGKVVLERSNIGWNEIADASGSLGGISSWKMRISECVQTLHEKNSLTLPRIGGA